MASTEFKMELGLIPRQFIDAAIKGRIGTLEQLYDSFFIEANIMATALCYAVKADQAPAVAWFLGAEIVYFFKDGYDHALPSPRIVIDPIDINGFNGYILMLVAYHGYHDIYHLIMNQRPNLHHYGQRMLTIAKKHGHLDICEDLCRRLSCEITGRGC